LKGKREQMKKFSIFILVVTAIFVIAACSDGQGADVQETPPGSSSSPDGESPSNTGTDPDIPDNGDNSGSGSDPNANDDPQTPPVFSFTFRDVVINMDDDIDDVIGKLGEPRGDFHVPSCAFDGYDRIVEYPGVQITAYPSGEHHNIFNISFFDDSIRTTEGQIRLGSPVQAVLDAYGDNYSYEIGLYKFTRGLTSLEFLTEDSIVMRITYRLDLGL
jgi:predicted small secreted protein